MLTIRSRWRLLVLMLPVAIVFAAVAIFMGGSTNTHDPAFAGAPADNSGVTCADVWLGELNNPNAGDSLPTAIGNPPPVGGINFLAAISLTTTFHNITENQYFTGPVNATNGVGNVINTAIPDVIAGAGNGTVPLCASVTKIVAAVNSVTAEPGGTSPDITAVVEVTADGGNPPLVGMVVYWDSSTSSRQGFYVVTKVNGSVLTLRATLDLCNSVPGDGSALGSLHACEPTNKGFPNPPFAYSNATTVTGGVLDPSTAPRAYSPDPCTGGGTLSLEACTSEFRPNDDCTGVAGTGCTVSIGCTPATGPPADPFDPVGHGPRTEIRTPPSVRSASSKPPPHRVTIFYTPVDANSCANNSNTVRSITYNVVWPLDGVSLNPPVGANADPAADGWDSDWDKDGCLDWEELAQPQPVTVAAGGGGRDAFNPYDCGRTIDGVWSVTVTLEPITINETKQIIPGSFFRCRASITMPDVRIYCYRDDPNIDVNPDDAPGVKGDGYSGSIWPTGTGGLPPASGGPFGDVNATHDVLTAAYSAGSDTLSLSGCLEDQDGSKPEGYVYWRTSTDISVLTGHGLIDVWTNQTEANCTGGTPGGGSDFPADSFFNVNIQIGIQGDNTQPTEHATHYDQDLDGVPNSRELKDDDACGRRDPYNRYDYYDVSQPKDGVIDLPNDILGVILHFAPGGYPAGDENWDRPPKMTNNGSIWNRGVPDGVIDLPNDILGVILQFNPGGCNLT